MDPGEQKALDDIDQYGCHVIHVLEDEEHPPFSYSVGVHQSTGKPEVTIIGLKRELAHSVVNEYNRRVKEGEEFEQGKRYAGFIQDFDVIVEKVDPSFYPEYFGWNLWLYDGPAFEMLQLVYPSTSGEWPWEPSVSEWFASWQPILNSAAAGSLT